MNEDECETVDVMIATLKKISDMGFGHYTIRCNHEYLLEAHDLPKLNHDRKQVEIEGY